MFTLSPTNTKSPSHTFIKKGSNMNTHTYSTDQKTHFLNGNTVSYVTNTH